MGQGVKNRVFGSDVPSIIKKKIEARQKLSHKDRNPYEEINSKYDSDLSTQGIGSTYNDIVRDNFDGVSDLSSRTPVVRAWVNVNISKGTKLEEELDDRQSVIDWMLEKDKKLSPWTNFLDILFIFKKLDITSTSLIVTLVLHSKSSQVVLFPESSFAL